VQVFLEINYAEAVKLNVYEYDKLPCILVQMYFVAVIVF
jgi:hypothetical protein